MSFELQAVRKRQSCQATKTLPEPSTSAEISPPLRRPPATLCSVSAATTTDDVHVAPPSVERNARMLPELYGTTTVPFGWTTGWPDSPPGTDGMRTGPHVAPPSTEVLIWIWSPRPASSHCVYHCP